MGKMKEQATTTEMDTRAFFDKTGTGIIIIDKNGIITHANQEIAEKTGYLLEEINGKLQWMYLVHEKHRSRMAKLERIHRADPGRISSPHPFQYRKKGGGSGEALLSIMMIPETEKRIVSIVDLTEKKIAENAFIYQRSLLELLITLSTRFINIQPEHLNTLLNEMLENIGEFTKMDRVYIFVHDVEKRTSSNTHEWCAPGVTPEILNLQDLPFDNLRDILNVHDKGLHYHIPDVSELPVTHPVRQIIEPQGIKSLVLIPLLHEGKSIGFVGFDAVKNKHPFSETELHLLKVAAEIISNALLRQWKMQIIEKNLSEKNILLAEIHHRVKNNLAIIASFLELQTEYFPKNKDPRSILRDMQHRIKSMSLVHEMVYENQNLASIGFDLLLKRLVDELYAGNRESEINISIFADNITLNMNDSVPLSLLANELIQNAWEHAFKDRRHGNIDVRFGKVKGGYRLLVSDDGAGIPETDLILNPRTLGYTIIKALVSQLRGKMEVKTNTKGLSIEVTLPLTNS